MNKLLNEIHQAQVRAGELVVREHLASMGLVMDAASIDANRHVLQETGKHPAPCARHCEATAFYIELRGLRGDVTRLAAELAQAKSAEIARLAMAQHVFSKLPDAMQCLDYLHVVRDVDARRAAPERCLACGGDDVAMPCAYPSGGKAGCIRDDRLKVTSNRTDFKLWQRGNLELFARKVADENVALKARAKAYVNFCDRCGQRNAPPGVIHTHTCTPPVPDWSTS